MRAIAKIFYLSHNAALKWIKTFAKERYEKPDHGDAIIVAIDEMRHYLKPKNKLWIWKAYRRETGELIDRKCGGRDRKILKNLMGRLSNWNVEIYGAGDWVAHSKVIPENKLYQSN